MMHVLFYFAVPPSPEDVNVSPKCGSDSGICDVMISWSPPQLIPDEYLIYIYNFSGDGSDIINATVPGVSRNSVYEQQRLYK